MANRPNFWTTTIAMYSFFRGEAESGLRLEFSILREFWGSRCGNPQRWPQIGAWEREIRKKGILLEHPSWHVPRCNGAISGSASESNSVDHRGTQWSTHSCSEVDPEIAPVHRGTCHEGCSEVATFFGMSREKCRFCQLLNIVYGLVMVRSLWTLSGEIWPKMQYFKNLFFQEKVCTNIFRKMFFTTNCL